MRVRPPATTVPALRRHGALPGQVVGAGPQRPERTAQRAPGKFHGPAGGAAARPRAAQSSHRAPDAPPGPCEGLRRASHTTGQPKPKPQSKPSLCCRAPVAPPARRASAGPRWKRPARPGQQPRTVPREPARARQGARHPRSLPHSSAGGARPPSARPPVAARPPRPRRRIRARGASARAGLRKRFPARCRPRRPGGHRICAGHARWGRSRAPDADQRGACSRRHAGRDARVPVRSGRERCAARRWIAAAGRPEGRASGVIGSSCRTTLDTSAGMRRRARYPVDNSPVVHIFATRRDGIQRGETTAPSSPGPVCAPMTAPTSLTYNSTSPGTRPRSRSASRSAPSGAAR